MICSPVSDSGDVTGGGEEAGEREASLRGAGLLSGREVMLEEEVVMKEGLVVLGQGGEGDLEKLPPPLARGGMKGAVMMCVLAIVGLQ